jgi:hypothetical protein
MTPLLSQPADAYDDRTGQLGGSHLIRDPDFLHLLVFNISAACL